MSSPVQDSNVELLRKVRGLSPEAKSVFQKTFSKAALVLNFLGFLEKQTEDKFRTQDAVLHLYQIKSSHKDYTLYENRFFKLRKKVFDYFAETVAEIHPVFAEQELKLQEIKHLCIDGKHTEATALMILLEKELWENNIFELLPELLDLMIYNNQLSKKNVENGPIYKRCETALALYQDLAEARLLGRQVYDTNITSGLKKTAPYLQKLQRLSIKNKAYPRFKLMYNLASAVSKLGGGGLDFKHDFKITNRFITVINQLHDLYPQMPDFRLIAGYSTIQTFHFRNLDVMNNFNAFRFREAAALVTELYKSVIDEHSSMRRMQSTVFFTSTCLVQLLGERYLEALETANTGISFLSARKETDKLPFAYADVVRAHIMLHPIKSGYSEAFIAEKAEQYIQYHKGYKVFDYNYREALWLKVKHLLVTGKYKEAVVFFNKTDVAIGFVDKRLTDYFHKCVELLMSSNSDRKQQADIIQQEMKTLRLKATLPPDYINYFFLEKLLRGHIKA